MAKEAYKHEPFDVGVEQHLLGALFADNGKIDGLAALVQENTFYDPLHGRIFSRISAMRASGRAITPVTLHAEMKSDPGIIETGGISYLNALRSAAPAIPNVKDYATILSDLATRRGLIRLGEDLINGAHEPPEEKFFSNIQSMAMNRLMSIGSALNFPPVSAEVIGSQIIAKVEKIKAGGHVRSVTTGSKLLDNAIGGMQGADLIIVAARAAMGKSGLLGGVSLRAAMAGHPTLVFSHEMRGHQWVERNITDLDFDGHPDDPIAYQNFRTGHFTDEQFERIVLANGLLKDIPLQICDTSSMTVHDIAARARSFKAEMIQRYGPKDANGEDLIGLIVTDYLQIVEPAGGKDRSREQEVAAIVRGHKSLAKELDWPVMAAAQMLNKGGDPRAMNKEQVPTLSGIRESGAIESEADIILAPHRKAWFLRKNKPDLPEDDPEMKKWEGDYFVCKNILKLYGLKFRHGAEYDLDLYCSMASSSIRDEKPYSGKSVLARAAEAAGQDLLASLSPHAPT